jgi:hypothetical protein
MNDYLIIALGLGVWFIIWSVTVRRLKLEEKAHKLNRYFEEKLSRLFDPKKDE